jgi:hypothetical protein
VEGENWMNLIFFAERWNHVFEITKLFLDRKKAAIAISEAAFMDSP